MCLVSKISVDLYEKLVRDGIKMYVLHFVKAFSTT